MRFERLGAILLPENAHGKVVYAEFPESVELPGFRGGGCGTPQRLCETPVSALSIPD